MTPEQTNVESRQLFRSLIATMLATVLVGVWWRSLWRDIGPTLPETWRQWRLR